MLQLRILCVGRKANDPLLSAAEDYLARLKRYARADLVRLREGTVASEAKSILAKVEPQDLVVALDERGATVTTRQLSDTLRGWSANAIPPVMSIGKSWVNAARPMPSTLPARRSRGVAALIIISMIRFAFSSTTPWAIHVP